MRNIWKKYNHILISNQPPNKVVNIRNIFFEIIKTNSLLARWVTDFDSLKEMPFWYIIKEKKFNINDLDPKIRNQIKKGLKGCKVRLVSKKELISSGYEIYINAFKSYTTFNKPFSEKQFQESIRELDSNYDLWGVFNASKKLIAYSQNKLINNICEFSITKFHPDFLKLRPSEALFYIMSDYYLNKIKCKYIHNGTRSIAHYTNIQEFLIKKFKFRKAYCNLHIKYHPIIALIIFVLFPFRSVFRSSKIKFLRNLNILLFQEEIKRNCQIIHSIMKLSDSVLILSNGNFKSGSTWVTAIIKAIIRTKKTEFPSYFQNPKYDNWINRFKIGRFIASSEFSKENIWISKTHIYQPNIILDILKYQKNIKVINIERDIKDVLVSHFHHLRNAKKINLNFEEYFNSWGKYKAIQYLRYSTSWKEIDFCLKIRYEDLITSNSETIKNIANYLEVNYVDVLKVQEETKIKSLRGNSIQKGLNEEKWFYRKGIVGDWENYFDERMLNKVSLIKQNNISYGEKVTYAIKFQFRLMIKYFLYRYFPLGYRMFDQRF